MMSFIVSLGLVMEFVVLHQKKWGFFGQTYYQIQVRVLLTAEEEKIAIRRGILHQPILDSNLGDLGDSRLHYLPLLCGRHRISMQDLRCGLTAKVGQESQKELLLWLKDILQHRCSQFKADLGFTDQKVPEILFTRQGVITEEII